MDLNKLNPNEQKKVQEIFDESDFIAKEKERLTSEPEIQKYFQQFNSISVSSFIDMYSKYKCSWHRWGAKYEEWNENARIFLVK
jgi:hypothetical protein